MGEEERMLELLAREYPTIETAESLLIYLQALQKLPKGTEYYFSDLHGEYTGFQHLLRSASGTIRDKISTVFKSELTESEQNQLANLIYNPEEFLAMVEAFNQELGDWKHETMLHLIRLNQVVSCKYTREHVRRALPKEYAFLIDELMHEDNMDPDKAPYYEEMIRTIHEIGADNDFIIVLCHLVQNLCVANLHIVGDIFDRGPRADFIMEELTRVRHVDIQWGNHDIEWMGAACGNQVCIASLVRVALGYNNFDVLEDGYGINLRPLSLFASQVYEKDPCKRFHVRILDENRYDVVDSDLTAKMLKAITIIQLKLEGQLLSRHPEYGMDDRRILEKINYEDGTVILNGKQHQLMDTYFPTINPEDPLMLSDAEGKLMRALTASVLHSEELQRHIKFLYTHGSMYKCMNGNLMFHGCIPMDEDGKFTTITIEGQEYQGKALMDAFENMVQQAYFLKDEDPKKQSAVDIMWYLWCGKYSPVFGKSKMATFEAYFIDDAEEKVEIYNPYYRLSKRETICKKILEEFGMDPDRGHIINGHVPVKLKTGEKPIRGNGKLFVIDGGISKAYQTKTGIAGYTLIFNSHHLAIAEHKSYFDAVNNPKPLTPKVYVVEEMQKRVLVEDTDEGREIAKEIRELKALIRAYKDGRIKQSPEGTASQRHKVTLI